MKTYTLYDLVNDPAVNLLDTKQKWRYIQYLAYRDHPSLDAPVGEEMILAEIWDCTCAEAEDLLGILADHDLIYLEVQL